MPMIDHLVLYASKIEVSIDFYGIVLPALQFEKTREWVWVGRQGVAIDLRQAPSTSSYDRYGPGLNHLGFSVSSEQELLTIIKVLEKEGLMIPKIQEIDGALCLFIPDPDGLRLEVSWENSQ